MYNFSTRRGEWLRRTLSWQWRLFDARRIEKLADSSKRWIHLFLPKSDISLKIEFLLWYWNLRNPSDRCEIRSGLQVASLTDDFQLDRIQAQIRWGKEDTDFNLTSTFNLHFRIYLAILWLCFYFYFHFLTLLLHDYSPGMSLSLFLQFFASVFCIYVHFQNLLVNI